MLKEYIFIGLFLISGIQISLERHFKASLIIKAKLKSEELEDGIFFPIITVPNAIERQSFVNNTWAYEILTNHINDDVAFISGPGKQIEGYKYIPVPQNLLDIVNNGIPLKRDKDIISKKVAGVKYFLEHTRKKWCWVTCDDVSIDADRIDMVVRDLNSKYDTEKDYVYIGHCFDNWGKGFAYLQGGPTFIISRKAGREFVKISEDLINSTNVEDDIKLDEFRKHLNLTHFETGSPFMFGHCNWIQNQTHPFDYLAVCPKEVPSSSGYGNQLFPIEKLVGLHSINTGDPYVAKAVLDNVKKAVANKENIYYFYCGYYITFCRK